MHAATISNSGRLQAVLAYLRAKGDEGATTRQLIAATGCCAINSIVAELRAGGIAVECDYEGTTDKGARIYRYRLGEVV